MVKYRLFVLMLLFVCVGSLTLAQDSDTDDIDVTDTQVLIMEILGDLLVSSEVSRQRAITHIEAAGQSGDLRYVAPLLDIAYFTRSETLRELNTAIFVAVENITGQRFGTDWRLYFEWASSNDLPLPEGYDRFKGTLFGRALDPRFVIFFNDVQATAQVNLQEVVWGGVIVDGIPSLVNALQISPEDAQAEARTLSQFCRFGDCDYPAPSEYVFGLSFNGDSRAYPLRQLNWHEMFNDVIGQAPLYDAPDGEVVCQFRAPTTFQSIGRFGDDFVQISGKSAGCPQEGWLADPESLLWQGDTWAEIREQLPDFASDESAQQLNISEGIGGQVPGIPVMLAYCTLCGSGILYSPIIPSNAIDPDAEGETVLEFGSTGMLMRSNKLMYDRSTNTVWNAITGTPAFGRLAQSDIQLERLPVVVTDWATWLEEHPDTSVLSLNTGFQRNYTNGAAYSDYFNDPEFLMFPVWQQDTNEQENKDVIFALNLNDTPKAYPLRLLIEERVTNDRLAGQDLVIVSRQTPQREFFEPGGASVRAYERGGNIFIPGENHRQIIDQDGNIWRVTEDALIGPDDETLARLPGHLAFWFGWYSFYPETLVHNVESS